MNHEPISPRGALPLDVLDRIDRVCDRFETAWSMGQRPRIEDCLGEVPAPYRSALLRELLTAEVGARRRLGERPEPREYLARLPDAAPAIVSAFEDGAGQVRRGGPTGVGEPSNGPATSGNSVLERIAATVGPVHRVVLRDTAPGEEPSPLVRPASAEMHGGPGRLQLFGEIARGGMGAVLKGRDPDLGRDLAVKVLLDSHRDNPDLVRRFVEEAQIAGQLQHPGVVPVHELGQFADDRPYFTMKLVKGRTLAEVLKARPDPQHELSTHVANWLQVCQTVAYAHARGVIHRDLKPSNVMLGAFGEVQVMDWGLAKVLPRGGVVADAAAGKLDPEETVIATARSGSHDSDLSRPGSVLGTPAYMAPEQARGETDVLDERCDVFSLGSMLCEVLTGQPAFVGRTSAEVQRKAARGDLTDAFARLDRCEADVELVAMAEDCLAPEADDRPRNAGEVAARGLAYLRSIEQRLRTAELERAAETARAEEVGRRVVVERQRRRYQVGLAASLLALTTLGGLGGTYYVQQRAARTSAAERALGEVSALLARARAQSDESPRWREVLAAARQVVPEPSFNVRLLALTREAEAGLVDADRDATLRRRLTDIRAAALDAGPAATSTAYAAAFRAAALDIDKLTSEEVATRLKRRPPNVVIELAGFLDHWSSVRGAGAPGRKLVELARRVDPDPFRGRVRDALLTEDVNARTAALKSLAADPEVVNLPAPTAVLLSWSVFQVLGNESKVSLLRQAVVRHPDDFWVNLILADALRLTDPAQLEEALRYYTAARSLRPELDHRLGLLLERMGRTDEAEVMYRDLVARRPTDAPSVSFVRNFLEGRGRPGSAEIVDRAVAAQREAIRLEPDNASAHSKLGGFLRAQGKFDEAVAEYREAIRLKPDDASAHEQFGRFLESVDKSDEATAEYRATLRLKPDDASAHEQLGACLVSVGKFDEAVAEYREALRIRPELTGLHHAIARTLRDQGKLDEAIAAYREAIRVKPDVSTSYHELGQVLRTQGRYIEALAELRRGHELGLKKPGWDFPSDRVVADAERCVALAGRLPAILKGEDQPNDVSDGLLVAQIAYDRALYAASTRLLAVALAADPKLVDDRQVKHRYNAACAAALAATGRGKEDPPPDAAAKTKLRGQALDWLKAERDAWAKALDEKPKVQDRVIVETPVPQSGGSGSIWISGMPVRIQIALEMRHWKVDTDLAGIRDPDALARLPEAERKEWEALWAGVDQLLKRSNT